MVLDQIINVNFTTDNSINLFNTLLTFIIFLLSAVILNVIINIYQNLGLKLTRKTKTSFDEKLVVSSIRPFRYFSIVISLLIAINLIFPFILAYELYSIRQGAVTVSHIFIVFLIFGFTYLAKRVLLSVIDWYSGELCVKTKMKFDTQMLPIVKKSTSIVVYLIGLIIILDILGIEIGPLLAGLGIAGLAVALALQDTLSNFFAGIQMIADKPISKGDFVTFDNLSGFVEEINWRTTRIKTWDQNLIIVPNARLNQMIITNHTRPLKSALRVVLVGVSYESDPDKVIKILKKTIDTFGKKQEVFDESMDPIVRFADFKESSIEFKIVFKITDFTQRIAFEDNLKLEIFKALRKNKIEIPYPMRTVHLRKR